MATYVKNAFRARVSTFSRFCCIHCQIIRFSRSRAHFNRKAILRMRVFFRTAPSRMVRYQSRDFRLTDVHEQVVSSLLA
jgi:hypothetical protein